MDEELQLTSLREKAQELSSDMEAIRTRVAVENRALSADEAVTYDASNADLKTILADIARFEDHAKHKAALAAAASAPVGRRTTARPVADSDADPDRPVQSAPPRVLNTVPKGTGGFRSLGDFARRVHASAITGVIDPLLRPLMATLSTYGSEGVGADGGALVPDDFRAEIVRHVLGEESLLSRTTQQTVLGNQMTFVKSEATPWGSTDGVQVYWQSEASAATQSKPSTTEESIRTHTLCCIVPVSNELMEDAPGLANHLRQVVPEKITSTINTAIISGNGVGKPKGILVALDASTLGPTLSIEKESSQVAATLVGNNVLKMFAAMPASRLAGAVWLINQDLLPQLLNLTLPGRDNTGAVASGWGSHVYLPPGQFNESPYGLLLGRPVLAVEGCSTLGTRGDIIFANLADYYTVRKASGVREDISIHLWFDQNVTAFKWTFRVGGQPWPAAAISPRNGSAKRSPFVVLDTRA